MLQWLNTFHTKIVFQEKPAHKKTRSKLKNVHSQGKKELKNVLFELRTILSKRSRNLPTTEKSLVLFASNSLLFRNFTAIVYSTFTIALFKILFEPVKRPTYRRRIVHYEPDNSIINIAGNIIILTY